MNNYKYASLTARNTSSLLFDPFLLAMSASQLLTLVELITNAVKVVIAEHDRVDQPLPSLDDPVPGPFDKAISITPDLSNAVKVIQAACAQLEYTVAPTSSTILMVRAFFLPSCYGLSLRMSFFRKQLQWVTPCLQYLHCALRSDGHLVPRARVLRLCHPCSSGQSAPGQA